MGTSSRFTFTLPGRRQKPPAPPLVTGPRMSKAQKILGSTELNVERPPAVAAATAAAAAATSPAAAERSRDYNVNEVTPWETASASSISLDRPTTGQYHRKIASPASLSATNLSATNFGIGGAGGLGVVPEELGALNRSGRPHASSFNGGSKPRPAAQQQWEDESAIVPRHIFSSQNGDGRDGGPASMNGIGNTTTHGTMTDSSSLRHEQSNSTTNTSSYYEKAKMPLSISQQTSSSAMAKGLPTKAEALLDVNGDHNELAVPGGAAGSSAKARHRKPPKLELSSLMDRSRGHRVAVGPSSAPNGHIGLVLGEDLVTKSPSILSSDTATSVPAMLRQGSQAKRFLKNHFRKSDLSRRGSTQPPAGIPEEPQQQLRGSAPSAGRNVNWERRHQVTRSTVILNNLYDHYEQRTFQDLLEEDINEAADETTSDMAQDSPLIGIPEAEDERDQTASPGLGGLEPPNSRHHRFQQPDSVATAPYPTPPMSSRSKALLSPFPSSSTRTLRSSRSYPLLSASTVPETLATSLASPAPTLASSISGGECDQSILSSRATIASMTSKTSKRAQKPNVDLQSTSVLSLSSDSEGGEEEDTMTDGGIPSRNVSCSSSSRGPGTFFRPLSVMTGSHSQHRFSALSDTVSNMSQDSPRSGYSRRSQVSGSNQDVASKPVPHTKRADPAGSSQYLAIPRAPSLSSGAGHETSGGALQPQASTGARRSSLVGSSPVGLMNPQGHHAGALPVSPPSSRLSTVSVTSTNPSFISWSNNKSNSNNNNGTKSGNSSTRDSMSVHEILAASLPSSGSQLDGAHGSASLRQRPSQLSLRSSGMAANFSFPQHHRPSVASNMSEQPTPPISPTSVDFYLAQRGGSFLAEASPQFQQEDGQQHPPSLALLVGRPSRTPARRGSSSGHGEFDQEQHHQLEQQKQKQQKQKQQKQKQHKRPSSSHARSASQRSNKTAADPSTASISAAPATAIGSETRVDTAATTTSSGRYMAVTHQEEMLLAALRIKRARMRQDIIAQFEDEIMEDMLVGSQEGAAGVAAPPSTAAESNEKSSALSDPYGLHGRRVVQRQKSAGIMHTRTHSGSLVAHLAARPHTRGSAHARRRSSVVRESAGVGMETSAPALAKKKHPEAKQQVERQEEHEQDQEAEEEIIVMMSQLPERPEGTYKDIDTHKAQQPWGQQQQQQQVRTKPSASQLNARKRSDAFLDFDDETDRASGEELLLKSRKGSLPTLSAEKAPRPGSPSRPKSSGSAMGPGSQRQQFQQAREQYEQEYYELQRQQQRQQQQEEEERQRRQQQRQQHYSEEQLSPRSRPEQQTKAEASPISVAQHISSLIFDGQGSRESEGALLPLYQVQHHQDQQPVGKHRRQRSSVSSVSTLSHRASVSTQSHRASHTSYSRPSLPEEDAHGHGSADEIEEDSLDAFPMPISRSRTPTPSAATFLSAAASPATAPRSGSISPVPMPFSLPTTLPPSIPIPPPPPHRRNNKQYRLQQQQQQQQQQQKQKQPQRISDRIASTRVAKASATSRERYLQRQQSRSRSRQPSIAETTDTAANSEASVEEEEHADAEHRGHAKYGHDDGRGDDEYDYYDDAVDDGDDDDDMMHGMTNSGHLKKGSLSRSGDHGVPRPDSPMFSAEPFPQPGATAALSSVPPKLNKTSQRSLARLSAVGGMGNGSGRPEPRWRDRSA